MSSPVAFEMIRVRRNPWVLWAASSPAILGALLLLGLLVPRGSGGYEGLLSDLCAAILVPYAPYLVALGLALWRYAWVNHSWPILRRVAVRADGMGLWLDQVFLPRRAVSLGFVTAWSAGSPPSVTLRRRLALPVVLRGDREEDCRSLLHALGLGAAQSVASFRVLSPRFAAAGYALWTSLGCATLSVLTLWGVLFPDGLGPAGLARLFGFGSALGGLVAVLLWTLAALVHPRLTVGVDGVHVAYAGRRRFFGYADIRALEYQVRGRLYGTRRFGVALRLATDREAFVSLVKGTGGRAGDGEVIATRIQEARDAFHQAGGAAKAEVLQRGDRSLTDWMTSLRRLGAGANADLRTAPVSRDQLLRIAVSAAQPAADRAAAAVALCGALDDREREQLRAAAEATAWPKLRVMIEKVADDADEEEVAVQMAQVACGRRTRAG